MHQTQNNIIQSFYGPFWKCSWFLWFCDSNIPKTNKNGGPVTLTHKGVTRYFMTIPEAAQLVIQSAGMAENGDLFLLDMGDPVKIYDLAKPLDTTVWQINKHNNNEKRWCY